MKTIKDLRSKSLDHQRGQAMLLIALAFVGLVGFVGLAIDAGIVFANIGHLRRGVDAAALSAANQIRQGWDESTITASAEELILLNLPANSAGELNVLVDSCTSDPDIFGCSTTNPRKLAQVSASFEVSLAFLPIIGWDSVGISADAISEAASVDLILVLDNSTSMAYDTPGIAERGIRITDAELAACNAANTCEPFKYVRQAAKDLVDEMLLNFDKISVVTFNRFAGKVSGVMGSISEFPLFEPDIQLSLSHPAVKGVLDSLIVYPNVESSACANFGGGDFRGCMATNTALGLKLAGQELTSGRARQESVKVVIILSDGVANAAIKDSPAYSGIPDDWYCPPTFMRNPATLQRYDGYEGPWCTDGDPNIGYVNPAFGSGTIEDPEDMTRAYADWVGCLPTGVNTICQSSGIGAVIFAVGLGEYLAELPYNEPVSDVGGQLLRYIARVGYNGDPRFTSDSPCEAVSTDVHITCGNYYFTSDGTGLGNIFQDIADRIFTRLTH
jgi:hypothetical protein